MPHPLRTARLALLALAAGVTLPVAAAAQARQSGSAAGDADTQAIASYALTMPMFNRIAAVHRVVAEEMKKDPRVAEQIKLKAERRALQKKEDPTEAEQSRLEQIEQRLEELDRALSESSANPLGNGETLQDMVAGIQKFAPLARALNSAAISPREYALFMMATIQAGFASAIPQSGGDLAKAKLSPTQVANVKFILAHQAELKALQAGAEEDK